MKLMLLSSQQKRRIQFILEQKAIQDEAMDVARSAPQGAHYHADAIYLLP